MLPTVTYAIGKDGAPQAALLDASDIAISTRDAAPSVDFLMGSSFARRSSILFRNDEATTSGGGVAPPSDVARHSTYVTIRLRQLPREFGRLGGRVSVVLPVAMVLTASATDCKVDGSAAGRRKALAEHGLPDTLLPIGAVAARGGPLLGAMTSGKSVVGPFHVGPQNTAPSRSLQTIVSVPAVTVSVSTQRFQGKCFCQVLLSASPALNAVAALQVAAVKLEAVGTVRKSVVLPGGCRFEVDHRGGGTDSGSRCQHYLLQGGPPESLMPLSTCNFRVSRPFASNASLSGVTLGRSAREQASFGFELNPALVAATDDAEDQIHVLQATVLYRLVLCPPPSHDNDDDDRDGGGSTSPSMPVRLLCDHLEHQSQWCGFSCPGLKPITVTFLMEDAPRLGQAGQAVVLVTLNQSAPAASAQAADQTAAGDSDESDHEDDVEAHVKAVPFVLPGAAVVVDVPELPRESVGRQRSRLCAESPRHASEGRNRERDGARLLVMVSADPTCWVMLGRTTTMCQLGGTDSPRQMRLTVRYVPIKRGRLPTPEVTVLERVSARGGPASDLAVDTDVPVDAELVRNQPFVTVD